MAYRIREGVELVLIQDVYLIAASAPCWDDCPFIIRTNELGAFIWNQLKQSKDVADIVNLIFQEYEMSDRDQIDLDVKLFIQNLIDSNYLIQERSDSE